MTKKPIRSDIGRSTADRISISGMDLPSGILGHLNLGDRGFLQIRGRLPDANESKMFNAMEAATEHLRAGAN